ncbi:hypothetical protein MVES_003762 [Malassezia vespertilionis]|uniref:Protein kinase domain-containing protein n=1 Tax=Malassezia vespertilionis TaxID=2020962 RepID=A0A2N1J6Z2_9BASI|nr:hypothetical protein MVES_003762 [Malassezia vespertilionis]
MQADDVIWSVIGHHFCSYKIKSASHSTFCRNEYNLTGLCNRQSCPLANSRYATVREKEGVVYLYIKTPERAFSPRRQWERIRLSNRYSTALEQIDKELVYWPNFIVHKAKQRLTKITQYLIKMRKLRLKEDEQPELVGIKNKTERREATREQKALRAAKLEKSIEKELLERLKSGAYGDAPLNVNEDVWNTVLENGQARTDAQSVALEEELSEEEEEEDMEEMERNLRDMVSDSEDYGQREFVSDDESDDESDNIEDMLSTSDESGSDADNDGSNKRGARGARRKPTKRPDTRTKRGGPPLEVEYEQETEPLTAQQKRKRRCRAAPLSESAWVSSEESIENGAAWYNTTSSEEEEDAMHPKRRATGSEQKYYDRWVSLRKRQLSAPRAQVTPLRTWRQRIREPTKHANTDNVHDTAMHDPFKPVWEKNATFARHVSPFVFRNTEPLFTRSPKSRRLRRRHESPAKSVRGGHGALPMPPLLKQSSIRSFLRANDTPASPLAQRGAFTTESDGLWDSDSDLSSLDESVHSDPNAPPREACAQRKAPRRMRTRSVSGTDVEQEVNADDAMPPPPLAAPAKVAAKAPAVSHQEPRFTQPILLRRRRQSLWTLCEKFGISAAPDCTKAALVDHLVRLGHEQPHLLAAELEQPKVIAPPTASDADELNGLDLESLDLLDREIPPDKLEKLEKIGSGAFKDVFVGKYHISRTRTNKVAISDLRNQLTDMDIKELTFLRDFRHQNIVRFIGISIPPEPRNVPCMIVSELCSNGDLFDYIRNTPAPSDAAIFTILLQIARGLEYLHLRTPMVIHRDCKSTNVLITKDGVAKIADFGFARVKRSTRAMVRSLVGTVNWQAVELWVPKPNYNEKVDVWSAAMTFWEALQWHQPEKRYPFQGMNEHQIYFSVGQKQQRPFVGTMRRRFGSEIVDLLDRMWAQLPRDRPSMSQVCHELEHLVAYKIKTRGPCTATRARTQ